MLVCFTDASIRIVVRHFYRIAWSWYPFSNLICFVNNSRTINYWHKPSVIFVSWVTFFECFMLVSMVMRAFYTYRHLKTVDYFKHRSRIVSLRFFVFHLFAYVGSMTFFENLAAATQYPSDLLLMLLRIGPSFLRAYDTVVYIAHIAAIKVV